MTARADEIDRFLTDAGWGSASRAALTGDASTRRYQRLRRGEDAAILMDAPPGGDTPRFVEIAEWLLTQGYSAPRLFAQDALRGLLLLEDLGDGLIARLVAAHPDREAPLYRAITEFLLALHRHPAPSNLERLDGPRLGEMVTITAEWYPCRSPETAAQLPALIRQVYEAYAREDLVMCLRDFHAENIIWLPERAGVARLGLLDFQDAVAAHPAYDLVSALQDARREVSREVEHAEIRHYSSQIGIEQGRFEAIYALLGLQRSLRILGVFARLCKAGGKPQYVSLLPRSWAYIQRNLEHPALADLRAPMAAAYPAPDDELLQKLRAECGQHPRP
ncbi:aminoglycoside phosphotransferase family protein [Pseudothioclava arenosa]|uniref:Aminoglycoside phosphotransferase n=1 Tax=Pseudothioclava arenosa TaxID=1795308 RepID=A0A2A4CQS3_9RHOB|nr:phosphotransferase [Pseudothioclava arenosa]PCD76602.1 aminoglycoside phosphotransferase [Pseudothioclava arenosa]